MPEPASILYGTELITRDDATARLLQRLLNHLPIALWDTDPTSQTLQRDLYAAIAQQSALWLENRTIARRMTLLLEAEGLDLDVLLQDYGLRRYLQRPDAFARQAGMHCLWVPKGTVHSLSILADLLFEAPHQTLRTGRNEVHVFLADTHAITTPYTYWGLISTEGLWYAVTIDKGLPTLSQIPPPGLNVAPADQTLHWFAVIDETQIPWYVTIEGDTLLLTATRPAWGAGTTEPFRVLDGDGGLWELRANRMDETLNPVAVTGFSPYAYWRVQSLDAGLYYVYVDNDALALDTTPPAGRDETPTAGDLDWFTVLEAAGAPWYVTIEAGIAQVTRTLPPGDGTAVPFRVLDSRGAWWGLQMTGEILATVALAPSVTSATLLNPGHTFQAFALYDTLAHPWWISIEGESVQVTSTLPFGATDVTPAGGPYTWLRVYGQNDTRWYLTVDVAGILAVDTVSPGGLGTATLQALGDAHGVQWHWGVQTTAMTFGLSDIPGRDFEGLSTALVLNDPRGGRWFWRVVWTSSDPIFEASPVLWPDSLSQTPWGEIGWLRMQNAAGATRYLFPTPSDGSPTVLSAPPGESLWGWSEPVTLYDAQGHGYGFHIVGDDIVEYTLIDPGDIPPRGALLSLRDARDAFAHVQPAGTLVTVLLA